MSILVMTHENDESREYDLSDEHDLARFVADASYIMGFRYGGGGPGYRHCRVTLDNALVLDGVLSLDLAREARE